MGKAWPRFFLDATAETTAHAILIEAHAILVEHLDEGRADLLRVHRQAIVYARAHYTDDEIQAALDACATAAGARGVLLNHWEALGELQTLRQDDAPLAVAA